MVNQVIRIPKGCVLWLDLTEDTGDILYDRSGHGNNGKVYGAVLEKRLPFIGRRFDGADDYVEIRESILKDTHTVVAWINTTTAGLEMAIYAEGNTRTNAPLKLLSIYNTGIHYLLRSDENVDLVNILLDDLGLCDGKWHMIAVSNDGSLANVYVDCNLVASESVETGTITVNTATVGAIKRMVISNYFNGLIAHVSLYNRAFTPKEIKYLYEEFQKRVFRRIAPLEIRMR